MLKVVLAGLLAFPVPAQAGPSGFAPEGIFLFHTDAQHDDRPLCSELWEFTSQNTLLIESGAERVRKDYRIETDRDGTWIISRVRETNGAPDCMGNSDGNPPKDEQRTYVVPMNDGRVRVCPAPTRAPSGAPFISNCYGWLVPADQAG